MGNEVSSSEVEEDQDGPIPAKEYEIATEVKNGPGALQSSPGIKVTETEQNGSKQTVQQEKVIASSQKTIVISPISNGVATNLQTSPPPPAAKSKFSLAILRPAPGRTSFQSNTPEASEVTLIKYQKAEPNTQETTGTIENNNGVQILLPPSTMTKDDVPLSQTNSTEVESAPPKPKEISIFHKLFKPERKVQLEEPNQPEIEENQAVTITLDTGLQSTPVGTNLQIQNIDDNKRAAVQELSSDSASVSDSSETISAATQPTPSPEIHPVMSFFKTLVTPNKSVPKSEEEVKGDADDKKKENGGLRKSSSKKEKTKSTVQQTAETEDKGLKKSDSPKSRTLSRLFRQKSKKDEPQTSSSSITASEDERKAPKEPAPPRKLFWRKASAEPAQQSTKGDSGEKATAAGSKSQESLGKKTEDGKNSKLKIMMFFKQLTLDITDGVEISKSEKTVVTAVVEPPPQKGKENLKEKKVSAEKLTKQDSRESTEAASSAQFQAPELVMVQNGGESSKDGQLKKIEKRQSLGSFFKAIGPKRMCDAEVQTDPVSILPAEKSK